MLCTVLKDFPFSRDGFTTKLAVKGGTADIPETFVPGLEREGFVRRGGEVKNAGPSPENKMVPQLENKHPLDHDGDGGAGGSLPAAGRNLDDLRAKAEAVGVKVDMRWGAARLQLEIDRANHK